MDDQELESFFFVVPFRTDAIPAEASLHSYDPKLVSQATAVDCGTDSLVQQHMRDEVDINTIVRRFGLTREMPSGVAGGVYGDFTGIEDYEGAVAAIERAREGFMTLPPEVRQEFNNEPGELIRFANSVSPDEFAARFKRPEARDVAADARATAVPVARVAPVVPVPAST